MWFVDCSWIFLVHNGYHGTSWVFYTGSWTRISIPNWVTVGYSRQEANMAKMAAENLTVLGNSCHPLILKSMNYLRGPLLNLSLVTDWSYFWILNKMKLHNKMFQIFVRGLRLSRVRNVPQTLSNLAWSRPKVDFRKVKVPLYRNECKSGLNPPWFERAVCWKGQK